MKRIITFLSVLLLAVCVNAREVVVTIGAEGKESLQILPHANTGFYTLVGAGSGIIWYMDTIRVEMTTGSSRPENMQIRIMTGGDYPVNLKIHNVTMNCTYFPMIVTGGSTVNLILSGNNKLTGGENYPAICVMTYKVDKKSQVNVLNISGTGSLEAQGGRYAAGIGGMDGRTYNENSWETSTGSINILSGNIKATGGYYGAGIGSGRNSQCNFVTIRGGNVEAKGGSNGAGIGNGGRTNPKPLDSFMIQILGGTVKAQGGSYGAAIGGGCLGSGGNIFISGGNITAQGGSSAAGIGAGKGAGKLPSGEIFGTSGGNINISGGLITARGGSGGAGIGGVSGNEGYLTTLHSSGSIRIENAEVYAYGGEFAAAIGSGQIGRCENIAIKNSTIHTEGGEAAAGIGTGTYGDSYGVISIESSEATAVGGMDGAGIGSGHKGVADRINIKGSKITAGTKTPATLRNAGSNQPKSIISKEELIRRLLKTDSSPELRSATADEDDYSRGSGIGSGAFGSVAGITIQDSEIDAIGGDGAAGIGGGVLGGGGVITLINNKGISTQGGDGGAGIGGGMGSDEKKPSNTYITVQGGKISAKGGIYASGIGGGMRCKPGTITIHSGEIEARGGAEAAGIGGGSQGDGGDITIKDGTLLAYSGIMVSKEMELGVGSGIGGGWNSTGGNITIDGGNIEAIGLLDKPAVEDKRGQPRNSIGQVLYRTAIAVKDSRGTPMEGMPIASNTIRSGASTYGLSNAKTSFGAGYVYAYLPATNKDVVASVSGNSKSFKGVYNTVNSNKGTGIFTDATTTIDVTGKDVFLFNKGYALADIGTKLPTDYATYHVENYTLYGTGETTSITFMPDYDCNYNNTNRRLMINDLKLNTSGNADGRNIKLEKGAKARIDINGQVDLTAGKDCAGIQAPDGSSLIIQGAGKLKVKGGAGAAGIGGGRNMSAGDITINSSTVESTGGSGAPGIGGGANSTKGANLIINGGSVNAKGTQQIHAATGYPKNKSGMPVFLNVLKLAERTADGEKAYKNVRLVEGNIPIRDDVTEITDPEGIYLASAFDFRNIITDDSGQIYCYFKGQNSDHERVWVTSDSLKFENIYTRNADNNNKFTLYMDSPYKVEYVIEDEDKFEGFDPPVDNKYYSLKNKLSAKDITTSTPYYLKKWASANGTKYNAEDIVEIRQHNIVNGVLKLTADAGKQMKVIELFPDTAMAEVVADSLSKAIDDLIKPEIVETITAFSAPDKGISSLEGVERMINLEDINLSRNHLSDISSLSSLAKLTNLDATNQTITHSEQTISGGSLSLNNTVIGIDGNCIIPENISHDGFHNPENESITWSDLTEESGTVSYGFSSTPLFHSSKATENTPIFSGIVSQPWINDIITSIDNEESETYKLWTKDEILFIQTEKPSDIKIYSLAGNLIIQEKILTGTSSFTLQKGVFIVNLNSNIYKVMCK